MKLAAWFVARWLPKWGPIKQYHIKSSYYRYGRGDLIRLRNKCTFDYGVRPLGVVLEYEQDKIQGDFYIVAMETYADGDAEWVRQNNPLRTITRQRHSKTNIEDHFKRYDHLSEDVVKHFEKLVKEGCDGHA